MPVKIRVPEVSITSSIHPLKPVIFDSISYICPSWDSMGEYTFELAQKIITSGEKFDRVIAIAKGGWTWTRTLTDYLEIDDISSVRIKSYSGVNSASKPYLVQPLTDSIGGKKILLFDEVIDTGHTIKHARSYLKTMGAKSVKIASLCYKPHSVIKPDYFAFETTAWVVFPHELREFITLSYATWHDKGVTNKDIEQRLLTIGLPKDQVKYFLTLEQNTARKV